MKTLINIAYILLLPVCLQAQSNVDMPLLQFQEDSVLIGMPTPVSFRFKHFWKQEIVFPDSTYNFSPFEFHKKEIFPTSTIDSISTDSVVYWLTTFEIDQKQSLKLPIFVPTKKDSIALYSNEDTIALKEVIPVVTDDLKVIENTAQLPLENTFNTPLFIVITLLLMGIIITVLIVFKKNIKNAFISYRLKRNYTLFLSRFDEQYGRFNQESTDKNLEKLVLIWKKYLEKMMHIPITKWSTKEIDSHLQHEEIHVKLKAIDRQIFGGISLESKDMEVLRLYGIEQYHSAITDLKNGGAR